MSDDVLVSVENVSKRFCRSLKRSLWYGMQDLGSELGGRRHGGGGGLPQSSADVELRKDEFWAVKDVSFELRRGECLGLIGRNGAGKTTLLRMLNGLIKPDTGRIETRGEVRALIALGAGFNPILTGRENIYLATSVLGLSDRQTHNLLDEIIEFSELEQFIDTPVQSYSSGMQVRLGFASAIFLRPDILILDEVLAVGDQHFRMKCMDAMRKKLPDTATIFVSHSATAIASICTSTLLLNKGRPRGIENVQEGLLAYASEDKSQKSYFFNNARFADPELTLRLISIPQSQNEIKEKIFKVNLNAQSNEPIELSVDTGFSFTLEWNLSPSLDISNHLSSRVVFQAADGSHPLQASCDIQSVNLEEFCRTSRINIGPVNLNRGRYQLIPSIWSGQSCLVSCVGQFVFLVRGGHPGDLASVLCPSTEEILLVSPKMHEPNHQ
jgi:ABC-type polysaccharide/polyol phosphate transport system ATPase subunit